MVMLTNLPREIFHLILEYLFLDDIKKLDLAIVNHEIRDRYLLLIDGLVLPSLEHISLNPVGNRLNWIVSRKILFQEIISFYFSPKIFPLISNCRAQLKSLSLDDIPSEYLPLGSFSSLTSIEFSACTISEDSFVNFFHLNPQLQKVTLRGDHFHPTLLAIFAFHCPNLRHLDLSTNPWVDDDCLLELVREGGNLNLLSLDVSYTSVRRDESICLVLTCFPNIRNFSFYECQVSPEMKEICLRQIAVPALMSDDSETLLMGLVCCCTNTQIDIVTPPPIAISLFPFSLNCSCRSKIGKNSSLHLFHSSFLISFTQRR
jgi:hypothetical protein